MRLHVFSTNVPLSKYMYLKVNYHLKVNDLATLIREHQCFMSTFFEKYLRRIFFLFFNRKLNRIGCIIKGWACNA